MVQKLKFLWNEFRFKRKVHGKAHIIIEDNVSVRGLTDFKYGSNCHICPNVVLWGDGELVLGNNVGIGDNVILKTTKGGGIYIGDNTLIAANSYIIDCNHVYSDIKRPIREQGLEIEKVIIGENCWIGANCTICAGTTLEAHVIVAANAAISKKHFESNTVVGGVPAKIIKRL